MSDDTRVFGWLSKPAPGPAQPAEVIVWRVRNDVRTASAVIRRHPHGQNLICRLGNEFLWSQVFRHGDGRDLGRVADDTLKTFESRGWQPVDDVETTSA